MRRRLFRSYMRIIDTRQSCICSLPDAQYNDNNPPEYQGHGSFDWKSELVIPLFSTLSTICAKASFSHYFPTSEDHQSLNSTRKMVSEFHTVYIICYRLHMTTYTEDLSRPHQKGTDDYTLSEAALERSSDDLYQVHPACWARENPSWGR